MGTTGAIEAQELSVAMTEVLAEQLRGHFAKARARQEDLCFASWLPSRGTRRLTAVLQRLILPAGHERLLHGNASFTSEYVQRVLGEVTPGQGVAFLHSHLGPGWQGMSTDDEGAERDRLASAIAGRTGLPLVGLTWGTDGSFSARAWGRTGRLEYGRRWAETVRVVGRRLQLTFHPDLRPPPVASSAQVATVSVWGEAHQRDLARVRVGIVGLGSVGSIVAEGLSRIGVSHFTFIDPDCVEWRNLDRTAGARREDARLRRPKVQVAERTVRSASTATQLEVNAHELSLLTPKGMDLALDCDVLFSCVDRPWPRHVLNAIAYAHLIPVVDGGILARVRDGRLLHVDWRIHTVGPGRPCLECIGAILPEEIQVDMTGGFDNPDYIAGLPQELLDVVSGRNVYAFSLSVGAHEILQFVGLVSGDDRVGGRGPQMYHAYPGEMRVDSESRCRAECDYSKLTGTAADLSGNLTPIR